MIGGGNEAVIEGTKGRNETTSEFFYPAWKMAGPATV